MEKKTMGSFLAALRRANGMTQKELAERLTYLRNLDTQREKYRAVIEEQGAFRSLRRYSA